VSRWILRAWLVCVDIEVRARPCPCLISCVSRLRCEPRCGHRDPHLLCVTGMAAPADHMRQMRAQGPAPGMAQAADTGSRHRHGCGRCGHKGPHLPHVLCVNMEVRADTGMAQAADTGMARLCRAMACPVRQQGGASRHSGLHLRGMPLPRGPPRQQAAYSGHIPSDALQPCPARQDSGAWAHIPHRLGRIRGKAPSCCRVARCKIRL
jgi:hypothetical protein